MTGHTVYWKGVSGTSYPYEVLRLGNINWNDVAGNYIFAKIVNGNWVAVYIGQTSSYRQRMPGHNELPCAYRNGATHVHCHVNKSGDARLAEERDLILAHRPVCNSHYKAA